MLMVYKRSPVMNALPIQVIDCCIIYERDSIIKCVFNLGQDEQFCIKKLVWGWFELIGFGPG